MTPTILQTDSPYYGDNQNQDKSATVWNIISQVTSGLTFIHQNEVVHGNLKLSNGNSVSGLTNLSAVFILDRFVETDGSGTDVPDVQKGPELYFGIPSPWASSTRVVCTGFRAQRQIWHLVFGVPPPWNGFLKEAVWFLLWDEWVLPWEGSSHFFSCPSETDCSRICLQNHSRDASFGSPKSPWFECLIGYFPKAFEWHYRCQPCAKNVRNTSG